MPDQTDPSRKLVLLVEDSLVNQKLLTVMLEHECCDVVLACNGQQGVEAFRQQLFDLVLMDIQMPIMDGLEACRQIRRYESDEGRHAPIVAVTAGMDRQSCIDAGMDDYIAKPVRVDVLRGILSRLFELSRT